MHMHRVSVGVGALFLCAAASVLCQTQPAITASPIITNYAGTGVSAFSGDGSPAIDATFNTIMDAKIDPTDGELYIVDENNDRIRVVNALTGIVTTFAGGGTDTCPNAGLATPLTLCRPQGIGVDSAGNLYIADSDNNRLLKLTPDGTTTLIAGTGTACADPTATVDPCGDNGPATSAQLKGPTGVVIDSQGNIIIADYNAYRIRKISPSGIITSIAGTGNYCGDDPAAGNPNFCGDNGPAVSAQVRDAFRVAVNLAGDVFIADASNQRIRKIDHATGIITTVVGSSQGYSGDGGLATAAQLNFPRDITAGAAGNLIITDSGNSVIRRVEPVGNTISTLVGTGVPCAVATDPCGDNGPGRRAQLNLAGDYSGSTDIDVAGYLYISDTKDNRIRLVGPTIPPFPPTPVQQSAAVQNIYLDINQDLQITSITVPASFGGSQEFSAAAMPDCTLNATLAAGTICTVPVTFTPAYPGLRMLPLVVHSTAGTFTFPLAGTGVGPMVVFAPGLIDTVPNTTLGTGVQLVARDAAGDTYFAGGDLMIRKLSADGTVTVVAGNGGTCGSSTDACGDGGAATAATFIKPSGLTVDAGGNLYISDAGLNRVRRVDVNGVITTFAGNGTPCADATQACGDFTLAPTANLTSPSQITFDIDGAMYIADTGDNRVRKVAANNVILTMAGTGTAGVSGDSAAAISAQLTNPTGVAVDSLGDIYIAETGNLRKIDTTGVITTVAGGGSTAATIAGVSATDASISPNQLATDAAGDIYIAESANSRITQYEPFSSTLRLLAGDGSNGDSGDGGSAISGSLSNPASISIDGLGELYIADNNNQRVRIIHGVAPLLFEDTVIGQTSTPVDAYPVNIGNASLNVSDMPLVGDFAHDASDTCVAVVEFASGASCNLVTTFQPQQAGASTGSISFEYTTPQGSGAYTIPLTATGLPVDTATTLSLSTSGTVSFETPVTLTASVAPNSAGAVTTTGTVSFYDNGILLGSSTITRRGLATLAVDDTTIPYFAPGSHSLTAKYLGDTNFNTSTTTTAVPLTVNLGTVVVALNSSLNPSSWGNSVTFTAVVTESVTSTGAPASSVPGGTVNFVDTSSGAVLATVSLPSSGVATVSTSLLIAGLHPIVAEYSGDAVYAPANSDTLRQLVLKAPLLVTASDATRIYGQPNPSFTIEPITGFVNGDEASVVTGTASVTSTATASTPVGTVPIVAAQGTLAAANYSFTFAPGTLTITKATPGTNGTSAVVITSVPNPSIWGQNVALVAKVPPNGTGSVNFMDGTTSLGTATIVATLAALTTKTLVTGTHPITAVYGGDSNYNGSSSNTVSQVVNKGVLNVTANDQQRPYGQPNAPLTVTITGFTNGDTQSVVSGAPVLSTTAMQSSPVGTYPITVTQGTLAATNYTFLLVDGTLSIGQVKGAVTLAATPTSATVGTPVVLTATVPAGATGTVTFYDGTSVLGTAGISGVNATLSVSNFGVGSHSITATYSGDANFTSAVSNIVTVTITSAAVSDFAVSSTTPPQLIPPGATASYNILIASTDIPFTDQVALTATGLPPGATYNFTPAAVVPGAAGASSTLTVSVPQQAVAARERGSRAMLALALLFLPLAFFRRAHWRPTRLLLWLLTLAAIGTVTGCGAGGYFSQTQQTYTITVTGTSGALVHSTTVTLTVE